MIDSFPSLLAVVRSYGHWFFLHFGLHCATHQIRVILISGVVITSLFYPALALYYPLSSQPQSLSIFGTASVFDAQHDLVDIWSRYDWLRVREDAVSRARCGVGRTVRVERVLILPDDGNALDHQTLLSTLNLENTLNDLVSSRCLKRADGQCLVLSPLEFWNHDKTSLRSDSNILDTLNFSRNASIAGIPLTPEMVLAGRDSDSESNLDFATFLALTYFFPATDCLGKSDHLSWLQTIQSVKALNAELHVKIEEPFLLALEYHSSPPEGKGWTAISALLYFAYISFAVYVSWSMRQMKTVHSRIGVTFTALVEIAVSTITSLSVCALVGFKVTMVPWELLPIMILFVGAENMFNLVDAVGKTHVTLPVKQRIAEGLSHAGTSNTLKVVFYNAVLGVIAAFSGGAIRQFCSFAVVVLVAHWFLAHTFFLAVLSIDMQRLELEELLRLDPSLTPAVPFLTSEGTKTKSGWQKQASIMQALFGGRAKKNLSLFLLLATTATLYYATLPSDNGRPITPSIKRGVVRHTSEGNGSNNQDPAWLLWKTLNPTESILHLRIESPTILTFRPDADYTNSLPKSYRTRWRSFRSLVWSLFRIMVLPISSTTVALYGLLLYLLKDTELLEAQKNRAHVEEEESAPPEVSSLRSQASFSTLPRAFASDVELIASSTNGQVVITVGLQNEIVIWHLDVQTHVSIDATDVLLRSASTSTNPSTVTCVAMDGSGEHCAVGTGAGVVAVWSIKRERVHALPHLFLDHSSAGVADIQFLSIRKSSKTPPQSRPTSPMEPVVPVSLVAVYESGTVAKWSVAQLSTAVLLQPCGRASIVKPRLLRMSPHNNLLVAFFLDDGKLDVQEANDQDKLLMPDFCVPAGNPTDFASVVHACRILMGDETRTVVGVATEAGVISLWDGLTGEMIRTLDETFGKITKLSLSPIPLGSCRLCGHLRPDTFCLTFSVHQIVHFFKVYHNDVDTTRRCTCVSIQTRRYDSLGKSSRSGSFATSSSPLVRNARLSSSFESSFPVSAHGVHSRRASEKDSSRRASTSETLTLPLDEFEADHAVGPADGVRTSSKVASFWFSVHVVKVADTTCERGGWAPYEGKIVGVRRRPRLQGKHIRDSTGTCHDGLPPATLDRWELWTFELSEPEVQTSTLSMLAVSEENMDALSLPSIPRLPFTRVTPFVVARSRGFAGFGNTLGVFAFLSS
ncbi:hypothetical protein BDZ89DRAFT_1068538 [Hymenopellis radicata]|nr:hypothetical protein BDZ89DRAFT_1068538 [Hymenopellis radicata]